MGSAFEAQTGRLVSSRNSANAGKPETTVVAIDEVQFFDPAVVEICEQLAEQGKRVICAGLDMDFRGVPFGPMPDSAGSLRTCDETTRHLCGLWRRSQPYPTFSRRRTRGLR